MSPGKIEVANQQGTYVIKLSGDVRLNLCSALESYLDNMFLDNDFEAVFVDLTDAEGVDSTTLGLLAKISIVSQANFGFMPRHDPPYFAMMIFPLTSIPLRSKSS